MHGYVVYLIYWVVRRTVQMKVCIYGGECKKDYKRMRFLRGQAGDDGFALSAAPSAGEKSIVCRAFEY